MNVYLFYRYVATECTFVSLEIPCEIGLYHVPVLYKKLQVILSVLQFKFMKIPPTEKWREIARRVYELWELPNCVGCWLPSILGFKRYKHRVNKLQLQAHPLVPLAVCDPDGN